MEERQVHIQRHTKRPVNVNALCPIQSNTPSVNLIKIPASLQQQGERGRTTFTRTPKTVDRDLHLYQKRLELTQRRILPAMESNMRDQPRYRGAQITPRGVENESIDWFVEAVAEKIGEHDEEEAEE